MSTLFDDQKQTIDLRKIDFANRIDFLLLIWCCQLNFQSNLTYHTIAIVVFKDALLREGVFNFVETPICFPFLKN